MTIKALVDNGISLRAAIDTLKVELDMVEQLLMDHAHSGEQIPLTDEEREGKQFLAHGTTRIVPVVFTADKIVQSFKPGGKVASAISTAAGGHIKRFYCPETTWEMVPKGGKAFRALAGELLGKDGPALVTAALARDKFGLPKSDIKVEWGRATEVVV